MYFLPQIPCRRITVCFSILICLSLFNSVASAEQIEPFKDEHTVVFIGDSITHGGQYHIDLALFYATRFPNKKIQFVNAGISGDTSVGTLKRFEKDIALHQPNVATIMLGMNDVRRELYGSNALQSTSFDDFLLEQSKTRKTYTRAMQDLIERLISINTKVIILTPSIFDQTAELALDKQVGINDELALYGRLIGDFASHKGQSVIDFQTLMLRINQQMQAEAASATIVSPDRIHPYAPGHFVMTYAMLKAQFGQSSIGEIVLNMNEGKQVSTNCKFSGKVDVKDDGVQFTCMNSGLPFPVKNEQVSALEYVAFQEDFNQYPFKVEGLESGSYELVINQTKVGEFSDEALAKGINLAELPLNPMYSQAKEVQKYNDARALNAKLIRDLKQIEYSMLSNYPELARDDEQALSKTLYKHIEGSKGKSWYPWLEGMVANYLINKSKLEMYKAKQSEYSQKMYEANQPKAYTFALKAVH